MTEKDVLVISGSVVLALVAVAAFLWGHGPLGSSATIAVGWPVVEPWQLRWKRKFVADLRAIVADKECVIDQDRAFSCYEVSSRRASLLGHYLNGGHSAAGDRAWLGIDLGGDAVCNHWWFRVDGVPTEPGNSIDGHIGSAIYRLSAYTGIAEPAFRQLFQEWTEPELDALHASSTDGTRRLLAKRRIDRFAYGSEPRLAPDIKL